MMLKVDMEEVSLDPLSEFYSRIYLGLNSTRYMDNISGLMGCLLSYSSENTLSTILSVHFGKTTFGPSHLI